MTFIWRYPLRRETKRRDPSDIPEPEVVEEHTAKGHPLFMARILFEDGAEFRLAETTLGSGTPEEAERNKKVCEEACERFLQAIRPGPP